MKSSATIIFICISCTRVLCQHDHSPIERNSIAEKFKYVNLTAFQVDSIYYKEPKNQATTYSRYFSSQKNKRGFEEFTIYQNFEDEIMCGRRLRYMIYSVKGELLGQFLLSDESNECGSDDSYFSKSYGKFIDDDTYQLYSEWVTKQADSKETIYAVSNFTIQKDGTINEKTVTRKKVNSPIHKAIIIPAPNDTLSNKIEYRAKDGHLTKSKNSLLVDNWLYDHDVLHSFEKPIPELKLNADYYLKDSDCYIMVFSERFNGGSTDKLHVINYFHKIKARFIQVPLNDLDNTDSAMREKFTKLGIAYKE